MLDLPAYRAHRWASWHVFAYAFVVYLLGIVAMVYHGSPAGMGGGTVFWAALLAAVAVTGIGYQEVREAGGFRKTERPPFADDEWGR